MPVCHRLEQWCVLEPRTLQSPGYFYYHYKWKFSPGHVLEVWDVLYENVKAKNNTAAPNHQGGSSAQSKCN